MPSVLGEMFLNPASRQPVTRKRNMTGRLDELTAQARAYAIEQVLALPPGGPAAKTYETAYMEKLDELMKSDGKEEPK